jgi:hypothetical protein
MNAQELINEVEVRQSPIPELIRHWYPAFFESRESMLLSEVVEGKWRRSR